MQIREASEAFFIAKRMEESAIRLYERALMICAEEMKPLIRRILGDERSHLRRFCDMGAEIPSDDSRCVALSAAAEAILYEGGLLGAVRDGLLENDQALLNTAAAAERKSADKYREFAEALNGEVRDALLGIAAEEEGHLSELIGRGAKL